MNRLFFTACVLLSVVVRAESVTEPASSEGTWQLQYAPALKVLEEADAATKKLIGNYDTVPIDPKTKAVLEHFAPALQSILGGVNADLHPTAPKADDIQPLIDQLSGARRLFNLTMLQVRADLARKDEPSAANDLLAAIALGRNIGREPVLISNLVAWGIEIRATEALAKQLPSLPPEVRANVRKQYESLPEPIKFSEVIRGEQTLAAPMLMKQMGAAAPEEIKKLAPFYDAVANAAENSAGKFAEIVQKEADKSPSVLAKILAPVWARPFQAWRRLNVQRALFLAAINVVENGEDSLMKTSDPAGEGPFEYHALKNGFELSSELRDKESKPVSLTVGGKE